MADSEPRRSRRGVLAGGAAILASGLAGCVTHLSAGGPSAETTDSGPVELLAAGSLNHALENGLRPTLRDRGTTLRVEARGSAALARLVDEGQKDPDIVSVADPVLFDGPLDPPWHAAFATNSVVIAYDPDTPGGRALADAGSEAWFRPLLDGEVTLGRTDPDLDPLGYRTLFALELATERYDTDADLREAIPSRDQLYPETQLVSQFETGNVDAAFTYRSDALARGYEYVDLPPEIDLSDPDREETYRTVSYTLPSGKTVRGAPVRYATTIRSEPTRTVRAVFEAHATGDYLTEYGFEVPDDYPEFGGDVPDAIAE
ncbi:extracellular solute-binding protein [Halorussus marinus]|uniref:extracellular solute-binding protein n=1 Tax=Halorussus marinus TaxID=2505976 RepID=UPI00106E4C6A|nr:extracellular solute-binding protein [Halorussus marinus]